MRKAYRYLASFGGLFIAITLVVGLLAYGFIPMFSASDRLSKWADVELNTTVLAYEVGWSDYEAYYRFKVDDDIFEKITKNIHLEAIGTQTRSECADKYGKGPWWWAWDQHRKGECWVNREYKEKTYLHYDRSSGVITLLRYTT